MKIAISSDHGGNNLRHEIINLLAELGVEYVDFGPDSTMNLSIIQTLQHLLQMEWLRGILTVAF